jgi:hypothetical protein
VNNSKSKMNENSPELMDKLLCEDYEFGVA